LLYLKNNLGAIQIRHDILGRGPGGGFNNMSHKLFSLLETLFIMVLEKVFFDSKISFIRYLYKVLFSYLFILRFHAYVVKQTCEMAPQVQFKIFKNVCLHLIILFAAKLSNKQIMCFDLKLNKTQQIVPWFLMMHINIVC